MAKKEKRFIPINQVKVPMPECFGMRCDYSGGYCTGCTVYCGCALQTKIHDQCVEHKLIPQEDY